ncbi:hypothetical protein PUN28_003840 [Cardiocondyla obscurior]|uniref:Uncharacterized protein n=1 Tax=Cardiocondyla obscurior TaxID=286306 RepID=A0AAW2GLY5_9HYME
MNITSCLLSKEMQRKDECSHILVRDLFVRVPCRKTHCAFRSPHSLCRMRGNDSEKSFNTSILWYRI